MRRLGALFACLLLLAPALAQPPAKDKAKPAKAKVDSDKWTVDDVLLADQVSDFQIAPDGRWAVWVKKVMDDDKGERVSNLMRTSLADQRTVELTRGKESCSGPRWSPDGKRVAFLSARPDPTASAKRRHRGREDKKEDEEEKKQIWLIDPFGGEPWRLTEYPRDVSAFAWAGDDALVFIAQEEKGHYEATQKKDKKDTSIVVEDEKHEPPVRLFRVDVESKKIERLTNNTDRIESLDVSPDGRWAVTRHNQSLRSAYDNRDKPRLFLHDLKAIESQRILDDPKLNISGVVWALDSKGFFVVNQFNSNPRYDYPSISELHFFNMAGRSLTKIDLDWPNGLSGEVGTPDGSFLLPTSDGFVALLADGVRNKAARYVRAGEKWQRSWLDGGHVRNISGMVLSKDGSTLLYSHSTASTPARWYTAMLKGTTVVDPKVIAEPYENIAGKPIARTEIVHWKGALEEKVEGILYYPHAYKEGEKRPLVVMIHGGPAAADMDSWDESWAYAANLFCQRGAFVFKPNYHGSSGYGLKFMESIADGHYYDLEVPDVEKGVDALIARGLVDPDKLGVMGWSNGSILTIGLTVHTTRYKAAVAGAGDVDWISDWGNCSFGDSFDRFYFGKSPLEDPETYRKKSPFYQLDKVRTPTLIFFGDQDRTVPTQQGWMHFRALQQHGKTDVRFVLFPGEEHGPKKLVHQRRKVEEELAWFDRYLFRTIKEADEVVKDDSPLGRALKLRTAKRDQGRYGERKDGQLIPETVSYLGMHVGRFEVTRAQFACFDPSYKVEVGKENYPASGISFEKAQEYCRWLSKQSGKTFRLPNEDEAEDLYGTTEDGENTLDHWAGYAVNPDDARQLRDKLKDLGSAALLREVGSFGAVGKEHLVFDLGGNVAEWTVGEDGKPKLRGGSADAPADAKQRTSEAEKEYQGFRVIREQKAKDK